MASSHYLNPCWLVISLGVWGRFDGNAEDIYHWYGFESHWCKMTCALFPISYMLRSLYLVPILPADGIALNDTGSPTGTMLIAKLHLFSARFGWLPWFLITFHCHDYIIQNGRRSLTKAIDTSTVKWHMHHLVFPGERNIDLPIRPMKRRWQRLSTMTSSTYLKFIANDNDQFIMAIRYSDCWWASDSWSYGSQI